MQIVNIHQAKSNLSQLINQLSVIPEIIIGKAGKPVAKLTAYTPKKKKRTLGLWKGKIWVAPDFDEEDRDINRLFYGDT